VNSGLTDRTGFNARLMIVIGFNMTLIIEMGFNVLLVVEPGLILLSLDADPHLDKVQPVEGNRIELPS
jgi:hypothetical protein